MHGYSSSVECVPCIIELSGENKASEVEAIQRSLQDCQTQLGVTGEVDNRVRVARELFEFGWSSPRPTVMEGGPPAGRCWRCS